MSVEVNIAIAKVIQGGEPYAQWIRRVGAKGGDLSALFGSSVEEPVELLTGVIESGFHRPITTAYQSAFGGGHPVVIQHLAAKYGVTPAHLICTTGATGALSLIYRTFLERGDRVLVERPGFDLFSDIATALGARVDYFDRRPPAFDIDLVELERALRPRTKLIVLSNLHNPSGVLLAEARLREIADLARRRGLLVVVDEVYGEYAEQTARPNSASRHGDSVVAVNSLTKLYGLSTLRCGWIMGAPQVIAPVRAVAEHFEFGVSNLAHSVAALVLAQPKAFDRFRDGVLSEARPLVESMFSQLRREGLVAGDLPPFGCIAFPKLVGIDDTRAFTDWLAEEHAVIVAPGEFFGTAGHVRIGFAQPSDQLAQALERFASGLRHYRKRGLAEQPATVDRRGRPPDGRLCV